MRIVPSPVIVITTAYGTTKRGVTCSSFTSVSLTPPIISFCIQKPSRMHNLLLSSQKFAVNILSENQVHLSLHFSSDNNDQFSCVEYSISAQDIPVLPGCCGVLHCTAHSVHGIGDHYVWYGRVSSITNSSSSAPLLYYARSYRSIGDEAFMRAFESTTLAFEEWSHEAHIRMAWNYILIYGKDTATPLIKAGIQKYNEKNKDKVRQGYHETVTLFFIHMIDFALREFEGTCHNFEEFLHSNPQLLDPSFIFHYYTHETISSQNARQSWVCPDHRPLP